MPKIKLSPMVNKCIKIMIASFVLAILNSSLVASNSWAQNDLQEKAMRAFQNFTSMTEGAEDECSDANEFR